MTVETKSPANLPTRFVLVAGEASGDVLGAGLIHALRSMAPDIEISGIGGPLMADAGMDCWHDVSELSVMGLAEVLRHLPRLLSLRRSMVDRIVAYRPAVFVGIDAPDFNLGLARRLRPHGIQTVQYVSPSVWAWRRRRAARMGSSVDRVLALFPFEPAIYAEYGVDCRFVGHPLADQIEPGSDAVEARSRLGLADDDRVLAVLPGSRSSEINRLIDPFLRAAEQVAESRQLVIVIPAATPSARALIEAALNGRALKSVKVIDGQARDVLVAADTALVASGTAALETLLARTPMVIAYKVAPLTYWLVKTFRMLKVSRVSLPNVLADDALVPEIMQSAATPANLAAALIPLLDQPEAANRQLRAFETIHAQLACGASQRAAAAIMELAQSR